jgi:hypothetical protein
MRDEFVSIHAGWVIDGSGGAIQSNMRLGQLKENMPATFLAVKGAPSQLPESLNQITMIYYKGNKININSYS